MGLFDKKAPEPDWADRLTVQVDSLLARLEKATTELASASGRAKNIDETIKLKETIADLKLQIDKLNEEKARTNREIEHKLGLHRVQVDAERAQSSKEAELASRMAKQEVREENLAAQQKQFDEQMKFRQESFDGEMARLSSLTEQILKRLPDITANFEAKSKA